jgi:hypothetical protein
MSMTYCGHTGGIHVCCGTHPSHHDLYKVKTTITASTAMTHHHHHQDGHLEHTRAERNDYVSSNKEHFDAQAASVANNPKWVELARR